MAEAAGIAIFARPGANPLIELQLSSSQRVEVCRGFVPHSMQSAIGRNLKAFFLKEEMCACRYERALEERA